MSQSILPAAESGADEPAKGSVSRRTLVKGAAWAVPVIALAAPVPAYAASECTPTTDIDGLQVGSRPTSIVFHPSGLMAGLSYAANPARNAGGETGRVAQTSTSPSWRYIEMEMTSDLDEGDWVDMEITFPTAVSNLSFTIHDIDKVRSGSSGSIAWVDTVIVTGGTNPAGTGGSYNAVKGTNVGGAGTSGDPFQPTIWGDQPISSGNNRVTITFVSDVTKVVIRYRAGADGNSANQHIGIGNLSYNACIPPGAGGTSVRSLSKSAAVAPLRLPADTAAPSIKSDGSTDQ